MDSLRGSSPPVADPHAAFVAGLFERCRRALLEYLVDLLSRREDAEDVVQETYIRLVNAKTLERSEARARAFMFKTATNLAYDRFRARRVRGVQSDERLGDLASDAPSPERVVAFEQGVELVKRALLELTPRCRQVFLLRTAEELGYDEIAQRLNVSRRTVEREMQTALELCQERLRPERQR
ncbi:MAG TPA: RNA polymerase sigma factor [Gammaproteobacteria bacterium]|nr:RNA polymerase sigma factor [Gammaproteobacteria bacterium]